MSQTCCQIIQKSQFATRFGELKNEKYFLDAVNNIEAELVRLNARESELGKELGIYGEELDSASIRLEIRNKALHNGTYQQDLKDMNKLHSRRLDCSRALKMIDYQVKRYALPLGPSQPRFNGSRYWATLIGIDAYQGTRDRLFGCISDVRLMESYLTTYLGLPKDHIQLLLGDAHTSVHDPMCPSRAHIVSMLTGLMKDDRIKYGDRIIIYYAGHGTSYYDDEGDLGFIEALCPIDRDALGVNGNPVTDISDREINGILTGISRVKGHRITVILDCCHSGSASRAMAQPGARNTSQTSSATLHDMLLAGDNTLRGLKALGYGSYCPGSILEQDWRPDMDSHIFIAACKDYQFAYEEKVTEEDGVTQGYVGVFTSSFVRVLQSPFVDERRSFSEIPTVLDSSVRQTPVVVGKYKNEPIWYQDV